MIAARPRRARAVLSWEDTHDTRLVRAVYGKDVQPGVQGDFTVRLLVPLERLQNRYTHKIFSMDWLSGILKRVAKIFGVWLAEKWV